MMEERKEGKKGGREGKRKESHFYFIIGIAIPPANVI